MECSRCRAPFSKTSQEQQRCALCGEPRSKAGSSINADATQARASPKASKPAGLLVAVALSALGVGYCLFSVRSGEVAGPNAGVASSAPAVSVRSVLPGSRPSQHTSASGATARQPAGRGFSGPVAQGGPSQQLRKDGEPGLRLAEASVRGRLPPAVIRRIVRQSVGRFLLCYKKGLAKNPTLKGRVTVRFVIGRDGRVSNISGGGDMPDGGVVSCVTRAFYSMSFPQPDAGIVTVSQPLVFSPAEKQAPASESVKGRAIVGGAGVGGGKIANASSVVARMRGRFNACYQAGLRQNPEMAGSVSLVATIGPNGEVRGVSGGGGGGIGAIVGCLKAVVRSGAFAAPEGGSAVVSIPVTFVKQ